jgi:hypothetical protein
MQQPNGAVGISPERPSPSWPTHLAILLWASSPKHKPAIDKAIAWLLTEEGKAGKDPEAAVGHDTTIVGWPWVPETHSWIEPTALSVLALRRTGNGAHKRTLDGIRLLRDRALPKGGWNYGNTIVFGNELRPQPAPTGVALAALADGMRDPISDRACAYLETLLPSVRAPMSLAWGLLGLAAWNRKPSAADAWLEEAFARAITRTDDLIAHLALLLLASNAPFWVAP